MTWSTHKWISNQLGNFVKLLWPFWQIWTLHERVLHSGKSCVGVHVVLESTFSVGRYVDYSKLMNCVWNFNLDMAMHDTWKNEMKSQRVFSDKTVSS